MLREPTIEKLYAMRLRVMASTWLDQDRSPDTIALPFDERLALIVDAEMLARENARLVKNLKDAKSTRPACARSRPADGLASIRR